MKILNYIGFLFFTTVVLSSCSKDLEVKNMNQPNLVQSMGSGDDVKGIASNLFNGWFEALHSAKNSPAIAVWTMADVGTCSWGNFGMRALSSEPRTNFVNTPNDADRMIVEGLWKNLYSTNSSANDVLLALNNGLEIGEGGIDTKMVEAVSYLNQGLTIGYLSLFFDKVYLVDENTTDVGSLEPVSYVEASNFAIEKIKKAIDIFESETFTLPPTWIPGDSYNSDDLARLAHSMVARLLVYTPRNLAATKAVDWGLVLDHANKGVIKDFAPLADDKTWYSLYQTYTVYSGVGRVDMRVINMMDPTIPSRWPKEGYGYGDNNLEMISSDARADTDFQYLASNSFKPERGEYHFSSYRYARLDQYLETWTEPMRDLTVEENELFKAEANYRLNNLAEAVSILNSGARSTRGNLPDLDASSPDKILDAIMYERTIEIMLTGPGIPFFDMRRNDLLQSGTPLHFPIPAQQLEILQLPFYTFGGTLGVKGEDVSDGGWE